MTAEPLTLGPYTDWVRDVEWSANGKYIAAGGWGQINIHEMPQGKVLQNWGMEDRKSWEVESLRWLENDKRLVYRTTAGVEMYDFDTNLKYRWGPGNLDHYTPRNSLGALFVLQNKRRTGSLESDRNVRLWDYPVWSCDAENILPYAHHQNKYRLSN